ncbi:LOW QUALITY PROTEIN: receptor protein-tyrosine kinase CEPR1-like [Panicum virgatum]|uniref:LOW QUALITY PROTEIN: receptor protein-tyrosine kinase CEPR1-like n=1 Tax=Panicum virgatum TaxID=38727 RepID=UPI0019D5F227|nr:LOW QUALITY PROTEIN: receptor protein-tyrosine kinase CEPR1-like [Panicum virgatum]
MVSLPPLFFWFILFLFLAAGDGGAAALDAQAAYLARMKEQFPGPGMSRWDFSSPAPDYCRFQGVACDRGGNVTAIDVTSWRLVGRLPPGVCAALPALRELRMAYNDVRGDFLPGLLNCTSLEVLNVSYSGVSGAVPDLSPMRALRVLDMSNNLFSGAFPTSITNATALEVVNLNENPGFDVWRPPESFMALRRIRVLILSTTSMRGGIPAWFGNMTSLTDLELSGNFLTGRIPLSLARLPNLQFLELYYNQLEGVVPAELGNLTELTDIDLSENRLAGGIPESLCALPNLRVLQMYTNELTGPIPAVLGNSTQLRILSVYRNQLTGEIPADLGRYSDLNVIEVSENQLTGPLPPYACARAQLQYILVLSNLLTGPIPAAYAECTPLLRFRVSSNHLEGDVPPGIFGLPHASIVDLSYNHLTGPVPAAVAGATNLTSLFASNNRMSGELPPEIAGASGLVKIDLSNNLIGGAIPEAVGRLARLNQLSLQGNRLNGSIPASLAGLRSLNVLNLSDNALSGAIPESLCALLPNSLDFSHNNLSGPVPAPLIKEGLLESVAGNPGLCVAFRLNLTDPALPLCPRPGGLRRGLAGNAWVVGACALACVVAALALARRWVLRARQDAEHDGAPTSPASSSSYDVKSFHKLSFDQHEILEALIDKNIVGHGGSGTVYKIELSSGELVAVKKLWVSARRRPSSKQQHLSSISTTTGSWLGDRELRTEVETLGSIRHKNIVKLYCCYSGADSNLLVYEYMPNGNLWEALHGCFLLLDWLTRHRVALGVAQGLAYLHHDLMFPIVHRDIKSSNILLDADFEPKVADFGIAKVLQLARGADGRDALSSTTTIAGTYGYLAPEYAYSSKATTKCDVYSFGVVLMELATGRKPIEPEFGDTRDIVHWVSGKVAAGAEADALDKRLAWSPYKEEMVQALRVAVRCTCSIPGLRPTMADVVQMLAEAGPPKDNKNSSCKDDDAGQKPKLPTASP